ncbi:MAG: sodium:proton antiporter [Oscillospiraceae bacterium]|nr:sodium:proton antiporter [Oscillospiraceae bacterium]
MLILFLVLFPLAAAPLSYGIGRRSKRGRDAFAVAVGALELGLALAAFLQRHGQLELPGLCGQKLLLELDGFRSVYVCVIALMWFVTLLFSPEYNLHHHNRNRYYFFNLMTLGATMGVFLAGDLFTAFVFFEIMSFTSFPWVIQEETPGAIKAGNTYLAVAVIGGLVALMGLFLLQTKLGTTQIDALYALAAACEDKGSLYLAGACVLFGFGAKAGMFPLHIWLPKAHPVAPAPASALLSGVLTKSGIWGILAISCNIFRADPAWGTVLLVLGCVTMFLGALLALFSVDLKRTLACSSMSQIGFILVGIGTMGLLGAENALAARGALLHMLNHSLFKLLLFLCAGVVYMNLHCLDLNEIRGFGRGKPLLQTAFLLGALGIGGIPLLNGYISKTLLHEGIVEAAAEYGWTLKLVEWVFLCSGGLTLAYMTKLYVAIFLEKHPKKQEDYDARRRYMDPASTLALCLAAIPLPVLGLSASWSMNALADIGTDFFHSGALAHAVHFYAWENLKGALISVAIGAAVYLLIVRKLLMKNGAYRNCWPSRLDLEELLYRPLLLHGLPAFFGAIAALFGENRILAPLSRALLRLASILVHAVCDLTDALILLLRNTVYRTRTLHQEDEVRDTLMYRLGKDVDAIEIRLGREQKGQTRYAQLFYRAYRTFRETSIRITGNLSFALFMLTAAICLIFFYIIVLQ